MRIDLKFTGIESVIHHLDKLSGPKATEAYVKALNDTGFEVRRKMQGEINRVFDRPTPFITKAPKVFAAKPDRLTVTVAPTMHSESSWQRGGKVGVDPQHVLQAQEWGGTRRDKKSEIVLRRAGILPAGYQTAIPATPYPGSDDGRGNLRGAFLQRLLSYLQAFGEQGYSANMKGAARNRFEGARKYSNIRTRKTHMDRDQRFFVVHPNRSKTRHLAPGIWAARAIHGVDLRPVLMFVRTPSYSPRLSMERIAQSANVDEYLARRLRFRIREAVGE